MVVNRIAIVGSRDYQRLYLVADHVALIWEKDPTAVVISGGARGVDRQAERTARAYGLQVVSHTPNYAEFGPIAPLVRNEAIVRDATEVVAFWDGSSRGTVHTIRLALEAGKGVTVFGPTGRIVDVPEMAVPA